MWRRGRAAQEVCGCALGTGTASREGLQGPTGGTVACVEQLCVCVWGRWCRAWQGLGSTPSGTCMSGSRDM